MNLTDEQAEFVRKCFKDWLRLRGKFEQSLDPELRGSINQLCADVDHSSLLRRLLSGKQPHPKPPPRNSARPN